MCYEIPSFIIARTGFAGSKRPENCPVDSFQHGRVGRPRSVRIPTKGIFNARLGINTGQCGLRPENREIFSKLVRTPGKLSSGQFSVRTGRQTPVLQFTQNPQILSDRLTHSCVSRVTLTGACGFAQRNRLRFRLRINTGQRENWFLPEQIFGFLLNSRKIRRFCAMGHLSGESPSLCPSYSAR